MEKEIRIHITIYGKRPMNELLLLLNVCYVIQLTVKRIEILRNKNINMGGFWFITVVAYAVLELGKRKK